MPLSSFHPAVAQWFERALGEPTAAQARAWAVLRQGTHALIAAPTGSGKTLAAFLSAIDELVREGLDGPLPDETRVLYVSPLKALSNDIEKNLQAPLEGIGAELWRLGTPGPEIRTAVRTGDTSQAERAAMAKRPPHILVTTPESFYLLLTSESGRRLLQTVRTVITDEIHALAGNKRGAHHALSLERLELLLKKPPVRIGLSATQKPVELIADFLTGGRGATVVDAGHQRDRDLAIELTGSPLEAVMAGEVWGELYDRLASLIREHRTTLVFVNTRRMAERVARHLAERLDEESVTSHHGSLSKEHRLDAEKRLKAGKLKALVATASLELGIDIGDVDLVCQLGSPRTINAFLQRVGRSGHGVHETPKGRLFPLSRDELIECTALLESVRRGELDRLVIPDKPLDVLAQQIVAEVAAREWKIAPLHAAFRKAWPYRTLGRTDFDRVIQMLAEGFSTRRGRRGAHLHLDAVHGRVRARRGARLTAVTNGGAIPDLFDFPVVLEPEEIPVGTVNEDFAVESLPGDIFQLGNTSYRVIRLQQGVMRVADAKGMPPSIPFWFGEAPGRSDELSAAVSQLRQRFEARYEKAREDGCDMAAAVDVCRRWLTEAYGVGDAAARQIADYLGAAKAALGRLPTQETVVFERFFDEAGDMHFVIHAPFGSRINRAWGLALRKRFCRKFNFELQAAALEDSIVLSLGSTHSFPIEEVAAYLRPQTVREVLIQAVLDAPLFEVRWRWVASIALAIRRNRNGRRVPPQLQRMDAEDLVALVFPDQIACLENIQGNRDVPDHPLIDQSLADCLHEAMDVEGLEDLVCRIDDGALEVLGRDLTSPSPLAQEVLAARPYAFLDDAPAEERRTLAVQSRRLMSPESAADLGRLDPEAIERVREEAWPNPSNADELHDALMVMGCWTAAEGRGEAPVPGEPMNRQRLMDDLIHAGRAAVLNLPEGGRLWIAAERRAMWVSIHPEAAVEPALTWGANDVKPDRPDAIREALRGRLEGLGPVISAALARTLGLSAAEAQAGLIALEAEGFAMRGSWTGEGTEQWCDRRLLARIHRYTLGRLRREIQPVGRADFMRFLFDWHGLGQSGRPEGPEALAEVLKKLEGFEAPAAAWEADLLPARTHAYDPAWLDTLCLSGRTCWLRLTPVRVEPGRRRSAGPLKTAPVALLPRQNVRAWLATARDREHEPPTLGADAARLDETLAALGPCFFDELVEASGLLAAQARAALGELAAWGRAAADGFAGLRQLIGAKHKKRRRRRGGASGVGEAGRWSRIVGSSASGDADASQADRRNAEIAWILLRRYGVMFRSLMERELNGLPPWRDLLRAYRRLEARGEIRGGRFVEGVYGEQFALPEAVEALRRTRKQKREGRLISISAADPLNLVGVVLPGAKVPALAGNRVLFKDGVPIAQWVGGQVATLGDHTGLTAWDLQRALLGTGDSSSAVQS